MLVKLNGRPGTMSNVFTMVKEGALFAWNVITELIVSTGTVPDLAVSR